MASIMDNVNEYLLDQMNAVTNEDVHGKDLEEVLKRAAAVANLSDKIIKNNKVTIQAIKMQMEYGSNEQTQKLLGVDSVKQS